MVTPVRTTRARCLAVALAIVGAAAPVPGRPARAQTAPAPVPAPGVPAAVFPTPIEVAMDVLNGRVMCRPPVARLPARDLISFKARNNSTRPILFVAPAFFQGSEGMRAEGVRYNPDRGGFLVPAGDTIEVVLRTPPAGEYHYACHGPDELPTVHGSGSLTVVSGPSTPAGAPPAR